MKRKAILLSLLFVVGCGPTGTLPSTSTPVHPSPTPSPITSVETKVPATILFAAGEIQDGIRLLTHAADGQPDTALKADMNATSTKGFAVPEEEITNYLYFAVDDDFYHASQSPLTIEIEYYDEGDGPVILQYDSMDDLKTSPVPASYKSVILAFRSNTLTWKKASHVLTDARFGNGQNGGADFRLGSQYVPLSVSTIRISKGGTGTTVIPDPPTASVPASYPLILGDRVVFTYYFYWYDTVTATHMTSLTNLPIDYQTITHRDPAWHRKQLKDIAYAGIDVILPIYWYDDGNQWWSRAGIEVLANALEQVRQEGITPPSVGMFLDTTSSIDKDLRSDNEKNQLYENIHFFFSTIPRDYWALTDGNRPILWFYTSLWPTAFDQGFLDSIYENFEKDFGVKPYLVLDGSWDYPSELKNGERIVNTSAGHLHYDATYIWGGALSTTTTSQITSIGPGYDDHMIPDRVPPSFTDRTDGDAYRDGFIKALMCPAPWLAIETWNEFHEGTDIAETVQYGRQYIDMTREFTGYFKDGKLPENLQIETRYTSSPKVGVLLGESNDEQGLSLIPDGGDGLHTSIMLESVSARQTVPMNNDAEASYLYFHVDDGYYFGTPQKIAITVTYFDNGNEPIYFQYDSANCGSSFNPSTMYREVFLARRHNTETWKTATIQINNATFMGNQNFGADFRLVTGRSSMIIAKVEIQKLP